MTQFANSHNDISSLIYSIPSSHTATFSMVLKNSVDTSDLHLPMIII